MASVIKTGIKAPRKMFTFYLDADLQDGLLLVRERDGVPVSETIRRSIRRWLEERDALVRGPKAKVSRTGRRKK